VRYVATFMSHVATLMSYAAPPYELCRHPNEQVAVVVMLMFVSTLKWHERHRMSYVATLMSYIPVVVVLMIV